MRVEVPENRQSQPVGPEEVYLPPAVELAKELIEAQHQRQEAARLWSRNLVPESEADKIWDQRSAEYDEVVDTIRHLPEEEAFTDQLPESVARAVARYEGAEVDADKQLPEYLDKIHNEGLICTDDVTGFMVVCARQIIRRVRGEA